jgi:Fe-S oxidoreductase
LKKQPANHYLSGDGLELLEYRESRENSLCCEGGGGRMFYEAEKPYERNTEKRVMEAVEKRADVLATSCPFCLMTLEDPATEKDLPVKELSEIIIEVL